MTSICKLMRIGRWSEPRFVFVCPLVEVIREADANETSGELGLALPVNPFGSWSEAVFCSACLQSLYCIGPSLPFSGDAGTMLYQVDSE